MSGEDGRLTNLTDEDRPERVALSEERRRELMDMVERENHVVRRARLAMIWSWVVAGLCVLVGGVADRLLPNSVAVGTSAMLSMGLLTIAAVLSVSYYVRVRGLSLRIIDARLANIEAELARLGAETRTPEEKPGE
ncbi:MAG: hypothetical protein FJX75_24205 [Armatimonadetes bacterium]|nr:hypothetical protein [Armatimonadota bacterium]